MEFGVAFASTTESWRWAKRAEELGFTDAWFYDTQLLNPDVFICMALAAANTDRIGLGTGVLIPGNRIAPVTANGLATLNRIAPGRIKFGVGSGFTGRRTMGLKAMRLADMEEYIRVVQSMLQEDTVEWQSDNGVRKIRFLNPDLGLINIEDSIPLHLSAFGEKSRKLTAKLGGGWLNFTGQVQDAIASITDMQLSWQEANRHRDDLHSTLFSLGCILDEGESPGNARAKTQAGPLAAVFLHYLMESLPPGAAAQVLPPELAARVESYRDIYDKYEPADARYLELHRGHLMFLRPEEESLVTADLIENLTFTGTREDLRDRIRSLGEAGYNQFTIQLVQGQEDALEQWADLFETV